MRKDNQIINNLLHSGRGVSAAELLFVVAIIAILAAIALPAFITWRQSIEYRQAGRTISSALREARGYSIEENRQYRVEFDTANRRFRFGKGDRSANSTVWENRTKPGPQAVVTNTMWNTLPPVATLLVDDGLGNDLTDVRFSSNGAATFNMFAQQARIRIRDQAGAVRLTITVTTTGRIQVQ